MIKLQIKFTDENPKYKKFIFPFILKPFLIKNLKKEFLENGVKASFESKASYSLITLEIRIIHSSDAIQKKKKFFGRLFTIFTPDKLENKFVEPSIKKELISELPEELRKKKIYVDVEETE